MFTLLLVACAEENFVDEATDGVSGPLAVHSPSVTPIDPWRPEAETILDCPWQSQEVVGQTETTLNCGPTSVVMAAACIDGFMPETQEIVDVITWMEENINSYNGTGEDNRGSYTNTVQLSETMEEYYGISAEYFSEFSESVEPASLQDLEEDLQSGVPTLIATYSQSGNETDVMRDGGGHFMLLVGMTPTHIVMHDPGPWDAASGAFHQYTIESFRQEWQSNAGVRFLVE